MFHLEAFTSSIATGAQTFGQLNYVTANAVLASLNNGVQVSAILNNLMAFGGVGAHMVHLRPQATSFQPLPYITGSPNNRGTAFESPPRIWDFSRYPIPLRPTEEFDMFATQNAGAAETEYAFAIFTDGQPNISPTPQLNVTLNGLGRFTTVHATSSTTLTAGGWTQCSLTFDQPLPPGMYNLVGARAFSATALLFRVKPVQGPVWRPGGVAVQAYDQMDPVNQRYFPEYGNAISPWGTWLQFFQNVPPFVEMFATAADTAEEFWLDLIKVSDTVTSGAQ